MNNIKKTRVFFIIAIVLLLENFSVCTSVNATEITGKILSLENKSFKKASIYCVLNNDGTKKNIESPIALDGKYKLVFKYEGFINLVVSIDGIDKLVVPCFVSNKTKYNLDMRLPITRVPYIDFDDIKLYSKNTGLVEYISDLNSAIFIEKYSDLILTSFNYSNDTTQFINKLVENSRKIEDLITKNKNKKANIFSIYASYLNSAANFLLVSKSNYINKNIISDFILKFPPETSYLHSYNINWWALASALPNHFENKYFSSILKKNQDVTSFLKCDILFSAMKYYFNINKNEEKAYVYYNYLKGNYSNSPQFIFAKNNYAPEKRIRIGKKLPNFSANSIENNNLIFNNNLFAGKYLLVNFWIPNDDSSKVDLRFITEASEIFYEAPFEILSIALTPDINNIIGARKISWQMPWLHSYEPGVFNGSLANIFEIIKAPFNILISPDGTIVELGENLSGRRLISTLKKYIKIDSFIK